jgi:Lipocalin-like domain
LEDQAVLRKSLLIAMACLLLLPLASRTATTQPAKDQFVGTWSLVSIRYVRPDGAAIEPFGPDAKGMLVFDGTRFATQVMAANLPKFGSNNRMVGTPQEYEAISHGVVAYFGTYTVSEPDRIVTLYIERSSFPNWEGIDQQRKFEFVGDELRYTAASSTANPAESALLVWKRVH